MKNLRPHLIFTLTALLILLSCNDASNTPESTTVTSETTAEINKFDLTTTTEKDALYALITQVLEIKFDEHELESVIFSRENYRTNFPDNLIEKINSIVRAGSAPEIIVKEKDYIEFSTISPHYEYKVTFKEDVILIAEKQFDENYEHYERFELKSGNYVLDDKPDEIQSLVFSDGYGKYELIISGNDIKITYQYLDYESDSETATLSDGKIVVAKSRLVFDGQKVDDVYKIRDNQLCAYNPETDTHDCYEFNRDQSTCSLDEIFN